MTEDHAVDGPNIGLLCFLVYRAMEARVLADLAAAGFATSRPPRGGCSPGSIRTAPGSPTWPSAP